MVAITPAAMKALDAIRPAWAGSSGCSGRRRSPTGSRPTARWADAPAANLPRRFYATCGSILLSDLYGTGLVISYPI